MGTQSGKTKKIVVHDEADFVDLGKFANVYEVGPSLESEWDQEVELDASVSKQAKTKLTATLLNQGFPWRHSARRLGELLMKTPPSEREAARELFRSKHMSNGHPGFLDALPPGLARHAFHSGWLSMDDAAVALKTKRFEKPLEDLFKNTWNIHSYAAVHGPKCVLADYSGYTRFERLVLMAFLSSWGAGEWELGIVSALRLATMSIEHDPSLKTLVDKVAIEFGQKVAKKLDLENPGAEEVTSKVRAMKVAFEQLGVSPAAQAKAVEGLAVFCRSKAMCEMLAGGGEKERPKMAHASGKQTWMLALRGSIGNDDARVSLLIIDAAKMDGLDLLGADCRWKCASAMRSAMGLACELGSIACAAGFGERGAASGVVVVDGQIIDAANPLLSLVERCLEGYLNPKGGLDAKVWGKAFASVFIAIGKEIKGAPHAERMMEEMGKKIEQRPSAIKKIWDQGATYINLGSHAGEILDSTAVSAATAMIERALMSRMDLEPQAPSAGGPRSKMRL